MIESVPYDLIIDTPALVHIRARIDIYSRTLQVSKDGKTEVLNLVYEPELFGDADDELTTDTESEIDAGEVSDKDEFSGFLMTLDATKEAENEPEEADLVRKTVEHLRGVRHRSQASVSEPSRFHSTFIQWCPSIKV